MKTRKWLAPVLSTLAIPAVVAPMTSCGCFRKKLNTTDVQYKGDELLHASLEGDEATAKFVGFAYNDDKVDVENLDVEIEIVKKDPAATSAEFTGEICDVEGSSFNITVDGTGLIAGDYILQVYLNNKVNGTRYQVEQLICMSVIGGGITETITHEGKPDLGTFPTIKNSRSSISIHDFVVNGSSSNIEIENVTFNTNDYSVSTKKVVQTSPSKFDVVLDIDGVTKDTKVEFGIEFVDKANPKANIPAITGLSFTPKGDIAVSPNANIEYRTEETWLFDATSTGETKDVNALYSGFILGDTYDLSKLKVDAYSNAVGAWFAKIVDCGGNKFDIYVMCQNIQPINLKPVNIDFRFTYTDEGNPIHFELPGYDMEIVDRQNIGIDDFNDWCIPKVLGSDYVYPDMRVLAPKTAAMSIFSGDRVDSNENLVAIMPDRPNIPGTNVNQIVDRTGNGKITFQWFKENFQSEVHTSSCFYYIPEIMK